MKCLISFFFLCLLFANSFAQNKQISSRNTVVQELLERWIENNESTIDYTDLQEQLEYYYNNKLDLNKCSQKDLMSLVFLSPRQADAIIKHRLELGNFMSVFELQVIPEIDEQTIYYLKYFVSVNFDWMQDQTPFWQMLRKGKNELILLHENDFQKKEGYNTEELKFANKQYYLGTPYRYVARYRFNYGNRLSMGYTGEKDMGEQFFQGAQAYGFDFNSFHFVLKNTGKIKALAFGDYQVNFGQGLTFGSGLAARKSAYVMNLRRYYESIRPYRSLNENEFMRGAALSYQVNKKLLVTGFVSHKYINTSYRNADSNQVSNGDGFSSIVLTGYHRTPNEIQNKQNVMQTIFGANVQFTLEKFQLGLTAVNANYDKAFAPGTAPYQKYYFSGTQLSNFGVDYSTQLGSILLFGESSLGSNGGWATTNTAQLPLDAKLDFCMMYRNFSKDYQITFNNPFAENNNGSNEEAIYTAMVYRYSKSIQLIAYLDVYRSPWLRYLVDAPSKGIDFLSELQYNPNKIFQSYIRYKHEEKEKNQSGNITKLDVIVPQTRDLIRLHLQYKVGTHFSFKSRLEHCMFNAEGIGQKSGTLIYQDFQYKPMLNPLDITCRLAMFDIDDFNARVFAVESDVLYQYSVPLYQNAGIRYYVLLHYNVSKHFDIWLRYAKTTYSNVNTIGSGLEQIQGNESSDIKVQVRWSF
jgi:hypothetical protein